MGCRTKMLFLAPALALFAAPAAAYGHGTGTATAALAWEEPSHDIAQKTAAQLRNEHKLMKEEFREAMADIPRAPTLKYSLILLAAVLVFGMTAICIGSCILRKEPGGSPKGSSSTSSSSSIEEDLEDDKSIDYEAVVKALAERTVQVVGPKVAKGQAAKRIIQDRCDRVLKKGTEFAMDECVATLGRIFKALDAEEAMLLLDWSNKKDSADFPAIPLLLAGLLSPAVLNVSVWVHVIQVVAIFIPVFVLCTTAIAVDWGAVCGIPGIFFWCYSMTVISLVLGIAHASMAKHIMDGKALMAQKLEILQKRTDAMRGKDPTELTPTDVREIFVCSCVILEQGLIVEDTMRRSTWNKILGVGALVWLLMNLWTFFIIFRWVFVPGYVAFHKSAAEVSGDAYCGATVTVFTANVTCLLCVLFVSINMLAVLKWISDRQVNNKLFQKFMLNKARAVDKEMLGLPFASILVKAFFLRGNTDLLSSHLDQIQEERGDLEEDLKQKQKKLEELDRQIEAVNDKADQQKAGSLTLSARDRRAKALDADVAVLRKNAAEKAEEATRQAEEMLEERRKEAQKKLDEALGHLSHFLDVLRSPQESTPAKESNA